MIESVLVANRGEIAIRVFRTCRRLGIRTVAVYSDADANTLHVADADEAYRIGPPPARESYLNLTAILEAARASGAQAIHPGYGFLAENPDFAQAVIEAGLIWIGPPPLTMLRLGDKASAKALAEQHGVPILPGYHGNEQSPEFLAKRAELIGYPLLIKASAGGGGRGMRVVESATDFEQELAAAKRESQASFGDDRVLLERYVGRPRHVEVQIFGDQHGALIHLGERECSIQRRHQKLIEESPSPVVDADLRDRMGGAAIRLARAAGYQNAGTVEFLLDESGQFSFLEVNARLQVEHPVTELVTGLDLVELQICVATGEPLPLSQAEVKLEGHAIEARVIAEDPLAGFLPSSGTVERFDYPSSVRVDTWVRDQTTVSPYYDSLLAKVIAQGPERNAACLTLAKALQAVWVDGIADNIDLLLATLEHAAFLRGELHTGFLDEHGLVESLAAIPPPVVAAASALDVLQPTFDDHDPWRGQTAWRVGRVDQPAAWVRSGREHAARVSAPLGLDRVIEIDVGGEERPRARLAPSDSVGRFRMNVGGHIATVLDERERRVVEWQGRSYRLRRPQPLSIEQTAHHRGTRGGEGRLTAPMPARVVRIAVAEGEHVSQNQPLVILEAMKMEHVVEAPHAGVVTEICVELGEQVNSGARLLTLGEAPSA